MWPWRGRFPWDWHADVGFATGYTPEEREKLVDVYMNDFDFDKAEPGNPEIWPYWVSDVDFKHTKNLNF